MKVLVSHLLTAEGRLRRLDERRYTLYRSDTNTGKG
jgi:hypothetical protein